jgi:SpoVK/Ycf46/Vps4 family AAA+-type ATPase
MKDTRTSHRATDRMLSMLLVEIDGIASSKTLLRSQDFLDMSASEKQVIVVATTASIESIDGSLLRSGRLEDHIELQLPNFDQVWLLHLGPGGLS